MKNLKLILLLICSPISFFGQQLSGLWIGTLSNDSTSVRKDQSFEIILSQYKEKVYGYSRSTFIVNDTLYYIVKRVKGTITGDVCEVKDDHIVSHNFPKKSLNKGVKVISTFRRNLADSTWYLAGDWKTTQTKKYYTVTGKVDLKGEKDFSVSKLLPHLEELGLEKDVPVYASANKTIQPVIASGTNANSRPEKPAGGNKDIASAKSTTKESDPGSSSAAGSKNIEKNKESTVKNNSIAQNPDKSANVPKNNETGTGSVANTKKDSKISSPPAVEEKISAINTVNNSQTTVENQAGSTATNHTKTTIPVIEQKQPANAETTAGMEDLGPTIKKYNSPRNSADQSTAGATTGSNTTRNPESTTTNAVVVTGKNKNSIAAKPVQDESAASSSVMGKTISPITEPNKPVAPVQEAAVHVSTRTTDAPQYLNFISDSLVLILYDNGEVDGDTVSVLLNGEVFMPLQGLKTAAIRKTLYIQPGQEELTLVLYAENLGRYPPNTGLLVVYDGEERHQLRFSADLKKNASVVFRRKK